MPNQNIKRFLYWTSILVTAILCIFCLIHIFTPNEKYENHGEYSFTPGVSTADTVVYQGISLKPGVYYVEMDYQAEVDASAYCTLFDGNVFTGGLLTNGEYLYENLERTGFHIWLLEETDTLEVRLSYGGEGALDISGITITETDQLWTMYLTIIVFVFAVIMLLLRYHYHWSRVWSRERKTAVWGILLITLLASYFPLTGKALAGIDLTYHYQRIEGVRVGLLTGNMPMRIEPEWLFGQGFACGIFYCNGLLVIPAIFRLLGFTVVTSCNIYCVVLNFMTAVISYYSFRKIFDHVNIGLVCSALYTLSVFRMYKLYNTGDFGEGVAFTFLPLILYGYYRVFGENPESGRYKTAWIPLALGYGGVMQTHTLTCIIAGIWTVFICLIYLRRIFRLPTFIQLAKGALAALASSLWFLGPFLDYYLTQDVHIKHLTARSIQYRGLVPAHHLFHFWREGGSIPQGFNGMQYSYPVGVGLVLLVGLAAFMLIWFNGFKGVKEERHGGMLAFAKAGSLLGAALLLMSMNFFPWDRLQGLNEIMALVIGSLEFPGRVLGSATAFLIIPFGFSMWYFVQTGKKKYFQISVLVAVAAIATSVFYMCDRINVTADYFTVYNEEGMGCGFISDEEYVIEGTPVSELTFEKPVYPENVILHEYEKEYLAVNMECENVSGESSYIDLPILNYRDYKAMLEDGEELEIVNNRKYQIRVILPEYFRGTVEVRFVPPFYWRICELISLCMIVVFTVIGLRTIRERRADHA